MKEYDQNSVREPIVMKDTFVYLGARLVDNDIGHIFQRAPCPKKSLTMKTGITRLHIAGNKQNGDLADSNV